VCLCVWFCDHLEWLLWRVAEEAQVTVGGRAAPPLEQGLTFGVVELIFTYVCVYRIPVNQRMFVAPPTVHPLRVGRRSQFVLADTLFGEMTFTALLDLVHRSSTQVPLFMPRHLQTWYSRDTCRVPSSRRVCDECSRCFCKCWWM